jgi:hypothetical protein
MVWVSLKGDGKTENPTLRLGSIPMEYRSISLGGWPGMTMGMMGGMADMKQSGMMT